MEIDDIPIREDDINLEDNDEADSLWILNRIAETSIDQHRETLLQSKKAESTDFNRCLEVFIKHLI